MTSSKGPEWSPRFCLPVQFIRRPRRQTHPCWIFKAEWTSWRRSQFCATAYGDGMGWVNGQHLEPEGRPPLASPIHHVRSIKKVVVDQPSVSQKLGWCQGGQCHIWQSGMYGFGCYPDRTFWPLSSFVPVHSPPSRTVTASRHRGPDRR